VLYEGIERVRRQPAPKVRAGLQQAQQHARREAPQL
jgi:hypothetical protein